MSYRANMKRVQWVFFPLILAALFATIGNAQLNFASIGNWGSGSSNQVAVASVLKSKAKELSISFLLSPGSNFINGVQGLNDSKWISAYEKPYEGSSLKLPFYTVLGSEDWNGNHTAQVLRMNQVYQSGTEDVSLNIPTWSLPNWWYRVANHFSDTTETSAVFGQTSASVIFIFLDTYIMSEEFPYQNITKLQWDSFGETVETAVSIFDWVIVVGDKSILSSGASKGDLYLQKRLRPFLKRNNVDAYISGNDYDMEIIEDGSLLHINCGTGSKADPIARMKADNSAIYVAKPGFCYHKLTKKRFTTHFIDGFSGKVVGNYSSTRNSRNRPYLDRYHQFQTLPKFEYVPVPSVKNIAADADDLFLRIVGTAGLLVVVFFGSLYIVIMGNKVSKLA